MHQCLCVSNSGVHEVPLNLWTPSLILFISISRHKSGGRSKDQMLLWACWDAIWTDGRRRMTLKTRWMVSVDEKASLKQIFGWGCLRSGQFGFHPCTFTIHCCCYGANGESEAFVDSQTSSSNTNSRNLNHHPLVWGIHFSGELYVHFGEPTRVCATEYVRFLLQK